MKNTKRLVLAILTICMLCGTLIAQTSRGTVTGTIKDPNSAVIPGAAVTLTNTQTNVTRQTMTNAEGVYRFDAVDLGTYRINVEAPGFGSIQRTDVYVSANQTAVVDVDLKVSGVETAVSVI